MKPSSQLHGVATLLGWGLLAALLLLSSIPKASTIIFTWPWAFYAQALLLAPAFLLAAERWQRPQPRYAPTLATAGLAVALGVSVLWSRQPHFSFEAALPLWAGLAWMLWIAAQVRARTDDADAFRRFARLVGGLMLVPVLVSAVLYTQDVASLMHAAGTWRIELTYHRNWYPLGHWNYTGGLALLTAPWLAVLAWREAGRWRALWLGGALVSAAVFLSASSRGAVIGALLAGVLAGGIWLARHRPSRRQFLAAAAVALLCGAGLFATNPRLRELVANPGSIRQPSEGDVQRLGMAQAGWLLGQQRPWLGHGPGMVPFVYPEVRAQVVGGVETSYQLHNGPLHLWVTLGGLGLAAAAGLLAVGARDLRHWWKSSASEPRSLALASGGALVAYAGLALTDYQLDVIALVALVGLHAGVVCAAPQTAAALAPTPRPGRGLLTPAILALGGVAAVVVLIPHWRARQIHWKALSDTPAADRVLLAQRILGAVDVAPWDPHYRNAAGFQLARAAVAGSDAKLRAIARAILTDSLKLDPAQEPVHAALGWLWLPDDPTPARQHFEAARHLLPDRLSNNFGLALACIGLDDRAAATHALAMELVVNPGFILSPYWNLEPLSEYREYSYQRSRELMALALASPQLPTWRRPPLLQARAVVRWWREGVPPSAEELAGATPDQRAILAALAATSTTPSSLPQSWRALSEAVAHPADAKAILATALNGATPAALGNALDRLNANPATLAAALRAPSSPRATLTRNALDREHYSLMHRNLDGPGYADLTPYLDDPFLLTFVAPLLPLRGIVPGPVLESLPQQADH